MPSPFPGMDPYLEERAVWPDVHTSLMTYIREALQPQIRPKYVARTGERIHLAGVSHSVIPLNPKTSPLPSARHTSRLPG